MSDRLDAPFYTLAADGRYVHICRMRGHTQYWLNVGAKLWVCYACHPPAEGATVEVRPSGHAKGGMVEELERDAEQV